MINDQASLGICTCRNSTSVSNFINDIVKYIGCSIRLFADCTSFYIVVHCPLQAGELLNRDLSTILKWADSWLVTFNPSKTLTMLIPQKRNSVFHPPISMDGVIIDETLDLCKSPSYIFFILDIFMKYISLYELL